MRLEERLANLPSRYLPLVIAGLVLAVSTILIIGADYQAKQERRAMALATAETFERSIAAIHAYFSREVFPRAVKGGAEPAPRYQDHDDRIPFPATMAMDFGEELQTTLPGLNTNLFSDYPFSWRADRELDAFERASLEATRANPEEPFVRFEVMGGREVVRLARAVVMKPDCVECHMRAEFGLTRVWKVGDVRGARQVSVPLPAASSAITESWLWACVVAVLAAVLGSLLVLPAVQGLRRSLADSRDLSSKLRSSNEALESANEAKSRFLAGISHDLRTPLNAVIGFSEVLRNQSLGPLGNERYLDYAGYVHGSGRHLLAMINQLMDIGRIESGAWPYQEGPIAVGNLIETLQPVLESSVTSAGMSLVAQDRSRNLTFRGDETAIRQIVINLVDNAAKYSGGSRVEVTFEQENGTAHRNGLRISVRDDGTGIEESEITSLKALHYRGRSSEGCEKTGLGIGLWLVDNLVQLHDSSLEIDSAPGQGCRFHLLIPEERLVLAAAE